MTQKKYIRVCARALIFDQDHLLCAISHRYNGKIFLPGGGIDVGEDARTSLARELQEELHINAQAGDFVSVIENGWLFEGKNYHEINFLFHVPVHGLNKNQTIQSYEEHISFGWYPVDKLAQIEWLVPEALKTIVPQWHKDKKAQAFFSNMNKG